MSDDVPGGTEIRRPLELVLEVGERVTLRLDTEPERVVSVTRTRRDRVVVRAPGYRVVARESM